MEHFHCRRKQNFDTTVKYKATVDYSHVQCGMRTEVPDYFLLPHDQNRISIGKWHVEFFFTFSSLIQIYQLIIGNKKI